MFELRTAPAPAAFSELGTVVEIREIGGMRQVEIVMENKEAGGDVAGLKRRYLAEALHVDGQPIGLEMLAKLPSRFTLPLIDAQATMNELHAGLVEAAGSVEGDDAPKV